MDNNFGNGFQPNPEQDASGMGGSVYQQPQNSGADSNPQAGQYQQPVGGADPYQQGGYNGGQYQQPTGGADPYQQGGYNGGQYQQPTGGADPYQQGSYNGGQYQQPMGGADPYQQGSYNGGQYQQPMGGADPYQQGSYNGGQYQQPNGTGAAPAQPKEKAKVKAIISLILGILAILLDCCCTYFGIALGIGAIILAVLDRKDNGGKFSGLGLAGLICAIVAVAFALICILLVVVGVVDTSWLEDLIG